MFKKYIYLDYAAATPVDKKAFKAMQKYWNKEFGNPSAIHSIGIKAKKVLTTARREIADLLGAHIDEIIFTSGGTESNNLALQGVIKKAKKTVKKPHIITSTIEHPSVLNVCQALEKNGVEVTYIKPNLEGVVDPKEIKGALKENTILVSIMYANNEIGTIQPIKDIAKVVRQFKKFSNTNKIYPLFHTDACQAVNYLDINVLRLGVDLLSASGAKFYGPKGIGFLYKKRNIPMFSMVQGGGQENGLRAGTENTPLIVGMAQALKISQEIKEKETSRLVDLRDYFIQSVLNKFPEAVFNGSQKERLPNNINFSFLGVENDQLVIELDAKGIAISAKSACQSHEDENSYVIMSLENNKERAKSSVRFSLGRQTTKREIDYVLKTLFKIINKIKKLNYVRNKKL